MVRKALLIALCGACVGVSSAQSLAGIGIRGGYYFGNKFDGLTPGSRLHLDGLELGADLTVFKLSAVEIRLSPTVVFGGATQHGSDTDGDLYRVILGAKFNAPTTPYYGAVGVGYAGTQNRGGHQFNVDNGVVTQLTLGFEPKSKLPGLKFYYEASYVYGDEQLSGLSLSVGVKF